MAGYFLPNDGAIDDLLYGPAGPVYRHIHNFGERVAGYAKAHAPLDTGALQRDIHATLPIRTAGALTLKVGSDVKRPGQDWSYALVVHQGHRALPVSRKGALMRFQPKVARGTDRYVYTFKVKAVPGRRYLTLGVKDINASLPADVQFAFRGLLLRDDERLVS